MQKTSLFLALFSLAALPAFGGTQNASVYEKNLSSADSWSDLSGQLKGRLPSNVVKEFAEFSKGISFPGSRRIKNKLVLTQNDGTRVTVEFKKDGVVSFNGKDWRFKPLGTVEEEVTRLALFLNGEKKASASFLGLESAAQAGGAGGLGVAAAAYAGANAYKADACGERNLSDELSNDCPLMAVKMQPVLVKARKIDDPSLFLPVSLKCPTDNSGTLELISKNILGESERIQVGYKSKDPKIVAVAGAEKASEFEEMFRIDLEQSAEVDVELGKAFLKKTNPVMKSVCLGSKRDKERYFSFLESNRKDLIGQHPNNIKDASKKSSMDAT